MLLPLLEVQKLPLLLGEGGHGGHGRRRVGRGGGGSGRCRLGLGGGRRVGVELPELGHAEPGGGVGGGGGGGLDGWGGRSSSVKTWCEMLICYP